MEQASQTEGESSSKVVYLFLGAIVVPFAAAIGQMMTDNKHVSSTQKNQDALVFAAVGLCAALGLAAYLHFQKNSTPKTEKDDSKTTETTTNSGTARPKDIWKVGQSNQTGLKKSKAAYKGKAFGSKYYYAHNDSNTTGGYKDGLKMEDYRMNGPRLLSKNGLSVLDDNEDANPNDSDGGNGAASDSNDSVAAPTRITAQDPHVKNITKYLWDDPGNAKGIATIRVDVLPGEKFGEFVDICDVQIKDVSATLPGEGLLAKITVGDNTSPSYQLKIGKLYGDAADVKVIIKPKKLLIKIYKKKHGFLSKNRDNMDAWPQPHRKI